MDNGKNEAGYLLRCCSGVGVNLPQTLCGNAVFIFFVVSVVLFSSTRTPFLFFSLSSQNSRCLLFVLDGKFDYLSVDGVGVGADGVARAINM